MLGGESLPSILFAARSISGMLFRSIRLPCGSWRKRIGKEGAELILKLTVTVGLANEAVELGEGYR